MSRSPDWEQATGRADALEWLARQPLALSPARPHDGPITTLRGLAGRWHADGQRERGRNGQIRMRGSLPELEGVPGVAAAAHAGPDRQATSRREDDHRPFPRVVRRIEGGDPRSWALVTVPARPSEVTFVASDLRLSKNLNWRSRWRGA